MKLSKTQKILGISALLLFPIGIFAKKKYDDITTVMEKLEFEIDNISNVRIKDLSLYFDLSVLLINPTTIDFDVDSYGLITVKKVKIYRDKVYMGEATSNITKIAIPAKGSALLKNIPIKTEYLNFLQELSNFEELANLKNYSIIIQLEAFGTTYEIEQNLSELY